MPKSTQHELDPIRRPASTNRDRTVVGNIDVARLDIGQDGTCTFGREKSYSLKDSASGHNDLERAQAWRAKLRSRPLLVVDLDGDGKHEQILIPDFDAPTNSFLADVPKSN